VDEGTWEYVTNIAHILCGYKLKPPASVAPISKPLPSPFFATKYHQ
jgi:hypothetical protein